MMGERKASAILRLFEQGVAAEPRIRAALLCEASYEGANAKELTLGDVDRNIWALRKTLFKGPIEAIAACSQCNSELEFELPNEFQLPPRIGGDSVELKHDGKKYIVRMPRLGDVESGRINMKALCENGPWNDLAFTRAVESELEAADPALRISIILACHSCASEQPQTLDIAGFIWASIEQTAHRIAHEVAQLARAFGWSEAEILNMSEYRRTLYLSKVSQ